MKEIISVANPEDVDGTGNESFGGIQSGMDDTDAISFTQWEDRQCQVFLFKTIESLNAKAQEAPSNRIPG